MRKLAFLALLLVTPVQAGEPLRVAVAANFKPALETISRMFQQTTGIEVTLSSASTGVLATQIEHGAPFDVFFAADRDTPFRLQASRPKKTPGPFCYARGRLVLAGGELSSLAQSQFSLAIANPATAPYGRAAMEVLARPEFHTGATRKLVRGNNVGQTYQFWKSGSVDLALLPASFAPADAVPVPQAWHAPVEQYLIKLRPSREADAYLEWIRSDTVRDLITEAGYEPCP